jgi:UDP-N-acetyl-D-glucosamine dehydrogenase
MEGMSAAEDARQSSSDVGENALTLFLERVQQRTAIIGVIGQGYVGLPLAVEAAHAGFTTIGFDVDAAVVEAINAGRSPVQDVAGPVVEALVGSGMLEATSDLGRMAECDALLICVPTPLNKIKDPDLSYVVAAGQAVLHGLRRGQLVVLESTTYPGTTREVLLPILRESGTSFCATRRSGSIRATPSGRRRTRPRCWAG